jgi:hypothetical protein
VARIFVAYHSFTELPLGPKTEGAGSAAPRADTGDTSRSGAGREFLIKFPDVISGMREFAFPWLAIDLVDWYAFPLAGSVPKALTCTDICRLTEFRGSVAVN